MSITGKIARLAKSVRHDKDWHRKAIGGKWEEVGSLQFQYLLAQGLQPSHRLLDIGCGSLRGGIHFIRYLEPGNYYGIEKEGHILARGIEVELPRYGIQNRFPNFHITSSFELSPFDVEFDYILAQSVFTHLEPDMISLCVRNVMPYLAENASFYATFKRADQVSIGTEHKGRHDEVSLAHYPIEVFEEIAANEGVEVEDLGDWGHPRGQEMLRFYR